MHTSFTFQICDSDRAQLMELREWHMKHADAALDRSRYRASQGDKKGEIDQLAESAYHSNVCLLIGRILS